MKKILKNTTSVLLTLTMLISLLQTGAFASPDTLKEDYELKILTFEDDENSSYWSDLIADPQYSDPLLYGGTTKESEAYHWHDAENTELAHTLPFNYGTFNYWGGGHAISNYTSADFESFGNFMYQLTVFQDSEFEEGVLLQESGGNNGSDNFAVHFGYMDDSGFNGTENLPALTFADGKARIIDHMYINNTTYFINSSLFGDGFSRPVEEDDWVKIIATGYNGEIVTGTAEFYLLNPETFITEWTPWELSSLGKVTEVKFNIESSVVGDFGMGTPAYFAYDDVAVRFEKAPLTDIEVRDIYIEKSETANTYEYNYYAGIPENTNAKAIIALYSENKFLGTDIKDINSGDNNISGSIITNETPDRYQIMIIDSLTSMMPLCPGIKGNIN